MEFIGFEKTFNLYYISCERNTRYLYNYFLKKNLPEFSVSNEYLFNGTNFRIIINKGYPLRYKYNIYYIDIFFYPNTTKNSIEYFLFDINNQLVINHPKYNKKTYSSIEKIKKKVVNIINYNG